LRNKELRPGLSVPRLILLLILIRSFGLVGQSEEPAFLASSPTIPVLEFSVKVIRHILSLRKTSGFCGKLLGEATGNGLGFSRAKKARIEDRLQPPGEILKSRSDATNLAQDFSPGSVQRNGTESRRDGRKRPEWLLLLLAEVIRVNPLRFVRRHGCDTNVEVDHQVGQMVAVNQHDLGVNLFDVLLRIG